MFTCAKLHIQIFVDQQTNISIEDIFVQAFRYRKGGERAGYGSTVDVLCYPAKPISLPDPCPYAFFFVGGSSSDVYDGSSTMLNPDLFLDSCTCSSDRLRLVSHCQSNK